MRPDRVMHVREWFQFQTCSHKGCLFSAKTYTQVVAQHQTLYGQWGNTNCFLFQIRPGAGKEVTLVYLYLLVLESWVPVPRTFACLCVMGKPWENQLTASKEDQLKTTICEVRAYKSLSVPVMPSLRVGENFKSDCGSSSSALNSVWFLPPLRVVLEWEII